MKIVLLIILIIVLLFIALILGFRFSRNADKASQAARIEALQADYPPVLSYPDTEFGNELRLNQIRYLATHNSYHHQAGVLQLAVLELAKPGTAETLRYSHLDFYNQLEIGVRSFELDIRYYRNGRFENIHVPLVDNRGHSPEVKPALEEMKLWSERHPLHVPVIVIMQTKDDWMFLDPGLKKWNADALITLDALIEEVMGDRLITPDELLKNGWPELGEARGKFIFVFHESNADYFSPEYLNSSERVSFFMDSPESPEASFILRNEPDAEDIKDLIRQGFIVRTRADADLNLSEEQKHKAIASGAQIISTDFPLGYASADNYKLSWNEMLSRYVY